MTYPFTLFQRPDGRQTQLNMEKIDKKDEEFLRTHAVKISMEDCGAFITIWADDGLTLEDDPDTPDEIIYIVRNGETCQEAIHKICVKIAKRGSHALHS